MTVSARNIISERSHHLGNQVRMVTDAVTTDYGHPAGYRYDIAAKVVIK